MSRSSKWALALGLLLLGSAAWLPLGLAVKYVVDIVAVGHSLAKSLLFLAFLLVLCLGVNKAPTIPAKTTDAFLLLVSALLVGNLAEYLWYCQRYGQSPEEWSAVVRDGFWTMSRLDHTHTAKAMLSSLPTNLAVKTDVGYAFGALLPVPLLWMHLLLFSLCLLLCTAACVRWLRNEPNSRAVAFVLTSFVLVKCAIDGGLLIPEVWAAFPVMAWLRSGRKGTWVASAATVAYLISLTLWKEAATAIILLDWLPGLLALSSPLLFRRSRVLGASALALALLSPVLRFQAVPSSRFHPYALSTAYYGTRPLQKGWTVHIVSPHKLPGAPQLLKVEAELPAPVGGYYLTDATLLKDTTPLELARELKLQLVRRPVSWYHEPPQVRCRVSVLRGDLQQVLNSPLVVKHENRGEELSLTFRPGVNRDLAVSLLGPHLTVVHSFNLSFADSRK